MWYKFCYYSDNMRFQRTIKETVVCTGIGLHTGRCVSLRLSPAPPDTGIIFIRGDKDSEIKATVENIVATDYSSTLGFNGSSIQTVEHLMAAIAGLNIDNLYVEVDSQEVPIMDGSAYPFVDLIMKSGIVQQDRIKQYIKIIKTIEIIEMDRYIRIEPSPFTAITYVMDFDHPLLNKQKFIYHYSIENFVEDIAPARTFGFLKDVTNLKEKGLGRGGSLENVIILDDNDILNKEGLRYSDEFVRHKVLDLIGDMALLPMSFIGHVKACRSGHRLNTKLAGSILENRDKWVEAGQIEEDITV